MHFVLELYFVYCQFGSEIIVKFTIFDTTVRLNVLLSLYFFQSLYWSQFCYHLSTKYNLTQIFSRLFNDLSCLSDHTMHQPLSLGGPVQLTCLVRLKGHRGGSCRCGSSAVANK